MSIATKALLLVVYLWSTQDAHGQSTVCTGCDSATISTTEPNAGFTQIVLPCVQAHFWRIPGKYSLTLRHPVDAASEQRTGDTTLVLSDHGGNRLTTNWELLLNKIVDVPEDGLFSQTGDNNVKAQFTISCSVVTPSPSTAVPSPTPTSQPTEGPIIANLEAKCLAYVAEPWNQRFATAMRQWGHSLPRCPPMLSQILNVGDFHQLPGDKYCVFWPEEWSCNSRPTCDRLSAPDCVATNSIAYYARGYQEGDLWRDQIILTCLYEYRRGYLQANPSGYYTKIGPNGDPLSEDASQVEQWGRSEGRIRLACCTDRTLCDHFKKIRPTNDGSRWAGWISPGFWGDPHFQTLDGVNVTFNGVGEYILIDHPALRMQFRTRQAGPTKQGSVITAISLQFVSMAFNPATNETNAEILTVQVEVNDDNHTRDAKPFRVFINATAGELLQEEDEIMWNGSALAANGSEKLFGNRVAEISARNFGNVIRIGTFVSAFSIDLKLVVPDPPMRRLMEFSFQISRRFANETRGMMGNFNGIAEDDLMFPNGTVLDSVSATANQVFEFGSAYQVSAASTLFAYHSGQNVSSFKNESYVPMLVPDFTSCPNASEVESQAVQQCAGSLECLLDAAVTCDLVFSGRTRKFQVELERLNVLLRDVILCSPPCGNGICRVNNTCDCFSGWNGTLCDEATFRDLSKSPTSMPTATPTQFPSMVPTVGNVVGTVTVTTGGTVVESKMSKMGWLSLPLWQIGVIAGSAFLASVVFVCVCWRCCCMKLNPTGEDGKNGIRHDASENDHLEEV